jgi:putative transposase
MPMAALQSKTMQRRKNIRLRNYDYASNGYYFVTMCSADRKQVLLHYQKQLQKLLHSLPERFPGISIDFIAVMPDHIHLIMVLHDTIIPVGQIIRSFKALATCHTGHHGLWQRGYYEHVIRNDQALEKIRIYIQNNLSEEKIDFNQFY